MHLVKKTIALMISAFFLWGAPVSIYAENTVANIPEYTNEAYTVLNENQPAFSDDDLIVSLYEEYSDLDELGRCGPAIACIGIETMPTVERGAIGMVKPSGWHTVKYDIVDGNYLFNRCHLIGYQLAGENANERNLITGTRYMNVEGMLPFENEVADYVEQTGNHVLYRVTPIFDGDNLVADGVHMEAESVEDDGTGVRFNVFVYNVQPGIVIDYATGDSWLDSETEEAASQNKERTYILNKNTKKFHLPTCSSANSIKEKNKEYYLGNRDNLIAQGYGPYKNCNP